MCAYEDEYPLNIEHYLSVFARALGIEYEDKYKKYRLWADPKLTLADMAPCMEANGVNLAQAEQIVTTTFGPA